MCKAAEVGKVIINRCLDRRLFIDAQKLQKLLVLMQVEVIKETGIPLFKEDVRIWDCGVAIKEVDDEFRGMGASFTEKQIEYINLLDKEDEIIDLVLDQYGTQNALELNQLPINQIVRSLGKALPGTKIPHVPSDVLCKVFAPPKPEKSTEGFNVA